MNKKQGLAQLRQEYSAIDGESKDKIVNKKQGIIEITQEHLAQEYLAIDAGSDGSDNGGRDGSDNGGRDGSDNDGSDGSDDEKVGRVIKVTAAICAGVATQPLPFADIFFLTPIQAVMASKIASIRGTPISESEATDILRATLKLVGFGLAAQQTAIGLYKIGLPFLAGFTTIPVVYGLTYGVGKLMDAHFKAQAKGQELDEETLRKIFAQGKKTGREEARKKRRADKMRAKDTKEDWCPTQR